MDGLVAVTRALVDGMKARGFGRIVNVASIAALGTAMAGTTFYAATKAAVVVLTRRFALELGPTASRSTRSRPGFVLTDMAAAGRTEADFAAIAARTMVRRISRPEDIAQRGGVPRGARVRVPDRPGPDGGRRPHGLIGHP